MSPWWFDGDRWVWRQRLSLSTGFVGPIQQSISANYETAQTLAILPDTLLPLGLRQLRLPAAQAEAEEAPALSLLPCNCYVFNS
ncbi:hypothetical protein D9M73_83440 [compost metagenome]